MRMHLKFSRFKGGPTPALGSDGAPGVPPTGAPTNEDNLLVTGFTNSAGAPVHRVAVGYKSDSLTPPDLVAQLWVWDSLSEAWYEVGAPTALKANRITYFGIISLADPPQIQRSTLPVGGSVVANAGSIAARLVVQDDVAANAGEYVFTMGPDLTVLPV